MRDNNNDERLKILHARLEQIKNKQEAERQEAQNKEGASVEEEPVHPTYNAKGAQSSEEDVTLSKTKKEKTTSNFPWKIIFRLIFIVALGYGGYYAYEKYDLKSLILENMPIQEVQKEDIQKPEVPITNNITPDLEYSLNFGDAKYIVIIGSFEDKDEAVLLMENKQSEGYTSNHFFLPEFSNSDQQIYQVYIGPFFSKSEAQQWSNTLDDEYELLEL